MKPEEQSHLLKLSRQLADDIGRAIDQHQNGSEGILCANDPSRVRQLCDLVERLSRDRAALLAAVKALVAYYEPLPDGAVWSALMHTVAAAEADQ